MIPGAGQGRGPGHRTCLRFSDPPILLKKPPRSAGRGQGREDVAQSGLRLRNVALPRFVAPIGPPFCRATALFCNRASMAGCLLMRGLDLGPRARIGRLRSGDRFAGAEKLLGGLWRFVFGCFAGVCKLAAGNHPGGVGKLVFELRRRCCAAAAAALAAAPSGAAAAATVLFPAVDCFLGFGASEAPPAEDDPPDPVRAACLCLIANS
jgi:hypothetical protein